MATTRITKKLNPLHSLNKTAYDLVYYFRHVNLQEFTSTLEEVRKNYGSPSESWLWGWFYNRKRTFELDQAISSFSIKGVDGTKVELSDWVTDFLSEQSGGWLETSANTNLMRAWLTKLHGYDVNVILTPPEIIELKILLLQAIKNKLEKEKLKQIKVKIIQAEKNLLDSEQKILFKNEEIQELEQKQKSKDDAIKKAEEELKSLEAEKLVQKEIVKKLEEEKCLREIEIKQAKEMILLLNPEINVENFEQLREIMIEAKLVGEASAKVFIKETQERERKKKELEEMRNRRTTKDDIKKQIESTLMIMPKNEEVIGKGQFNLEEERIKKMETIRKECEQRVDDAKVRSKLNKIFAKKNQTESQLAELQSTKKEEIVKECQQKKNHKEVKAYLNQFFSFKQKAKQTETVQDHSSSLQSLYQQGSAVKLNEPDGLAKILEAELNGERKREETRKPVLVETNQAKKANNQSFREAQLQMALLFNAKIKNDEVSEKKNDNKRCYPEA